MMTTEAPRKSGWSNVALWVAQVAVAALFLMAGGMKLAGHDPKMVQMFEKLGGQWFRYLTGSLEVLGAIGLLTPFASCAAAVGLFFVMIGAVITHVVVIGGSPAPAVVLLVLTAVIAYGRRGQLIGK